VAREDRSRRRLHLQQLACACDAAFEREETLRQILAPALDARFRERREKTLEPVGRAGMIGVALDEADAGMTELEQITREIAGDARLVRADVHAARELPLRDSHVAHARGDERLDQRPMVRERWDQNDAVDAG